MEVFKDPINGNMYELYKKDYNMYLKKIGTDITFRVTLFNECMIGSKCTDNNNISNKYIDKINIPLSWKLDSNTQKKRKRSQEEEEEIIDYGEVD